MEGFMAASPPAWNYERRQQQPRDDDMSGESEDDDDIDIQDIPNAHFDVLDTSRSTGKPDGCLLSQADNFRITHTPAQHINP
jgi:hypothetical protein